MPWTFESSDALSARAARRQFVDVIRRKAAGDYFAAELVFGELIGNVARHAPGRVWIDLDLGGPSPVLHVKDEGSDAAQDVKTDEAMPEGGRGLALARVLSQQLSIDFGSRDRGTEVTAVLNLRTNRA